MFAWVDSCGTVRDTVSAVRNTFFLGSGGERLAHGCFESLEVLVEKRFPLPICLPIPESRVNLFQFQSPSCNIRYLVRFILHIRYHDRFTFAILTGKNRCRVRFNFKHSLS